MTKTIRVKMKKGAIYDEVVWPTDYVLEMDEVHATYLCGTGFAEPSTEPCSPRPTALYVPPKDQATATGKAIADALKDVIAPKVAKNV